MATNEVPEVILGLDRGLDRLLFLQKEIALAADESLHCRDRTHETGRPAGYADVEAVDPPLREHKAVMNKKRPSRTRCIQRSLTWEGASDHRK